MYQGNNKIAIQSMDWIAASLKKLLNQKDYKQINISDLCDDCMLSRQTFYNVFKNKEEVLQYCLQKDYVEQFNEISKKENIKMNDIILAFISFKEKHQEILNNIIKNELDFLLIKEIEKCIAIYVNHFVKNKNDKLMPYSIALLSGALTQLLLVIFKEQKTIDEQELLQLLDKFINGNLYTL